MLKAEEGRELAFEIARKRLRRSEDFAESYLESLDTSALDGIPSFNFDFEAESEPRQDSEPEPEYGLEVEPEIESADPTPDPASDSVDFEPQLTESEPEPTPEPAPGPTPEPIRSKPRKPKRIIRAAPSETRTHKLMIPRLIKADNSRQPTVTMAFNQKRAVQLPPNKLDMDGLWLAHWLQFEESRTRL